MFAENDGIIDYELYANKLPRPAFNGNTY